MLPLLKVWGLCLLFLFHIHLCSGQGCQKDDPQYFMRPGPKGNARDYRELDTYYVGDTLLVQWYKRADGVQLNVHMDSRTGDTSGNIYPFHTLVKGWSDDDTYEWKISYYDMDRTQNPDDIFYLIMTVNDKIHLYSHYFYIKERSSNGSSTAETSSSSAGTATSTGTTKSPSESDSCTTNPGNSIGPGQAAGITIGGIAGLVLILGGVWYAVRRAGISLHLQRQGAQAANPGLPPIESGDPVVVDKSTVIRRQELP